jgi:hypothetical protein
MKKSLVIIGILVCLCGWFSCTKDTAVPPVLPTCDSTHVSYTKTMAPIVAQYCAYSGCHASPLGAGANDLSTYIGLHTEMQIDSPNVNSILCRIQTNTCGNDQMPKGLRPLNSALIDTFKLWKSGGYCN